MGGYSSGKTDGFIEGKIADGVLRFTWREGAINGRGVAQAEGEKLRGTWGTGGSEEGGGEWSGVRVRKEKTER